MIGFLELWLPILPVVFVGAFLMWVGEEREEQPNYEEWLENFEYGYAQTAGDYALAVGFADRDSKAVAAVHARVRSGRWHVIFDAQARLPIVPIRVDDGQHL